MSLEIATQRGFAATDARTWAEMLSNAGFADVRIRGAAPGDEPKVEQRGTAAAPAFHVVGVLTADNKLVLPKGQFGLSDRGRIEQWLEKLKADGIEGISVKPAAFGLLPNQLAAVHQALAAPVSFSTKDKLPQHVARQIAGGLRLKFVTDPAGQASLRESQEPVADELEGLSSGTALAAVLRPLGLVLVPEKSGGEVRLRIADGRTAKEYWPVGWPPKGNPRQTLPDLFKFLNVEIQQTPISEALAAISGRLKTPVLIDHNSLAREEISLATKVDVPQGKTYYAQALDRLLFAAKLRYELRVDEGDKPFLWVTTVRRQGSESK